jgi:hypothetical protein
VTLSGGLKLKGVITSLVSDLCEAEQISAFFEFYPFISFYFSM